MDHFIVSDILALAMAQATPNEAGRLALVNKDMAVRFRLAAPVYRERVVQVFVARVRAFFAAPAQTRAHLNLELKVLRGAKIAWILTLDSHACTIYRGGFTRSSHVVASCNAADTEEAARRFAGALIKELEEPFKEIRTRMSFRGCSPVIKAWGNFLAFVEAHRTPTTTRRRRQR